MPTEWPQPTWREISDRENVSYDRKVCEIMTDLLDTAIAGLRSLEMEYLINGGDIDEMRSQFREDREAIRVAREYLEANHPPYRETL